MKTDHNRLIRSKATSFFAAVSGIILSVVLSLHEDALAFWIWTPETGKWVNPKYSVKDTPKEQYEWGARLLELGEYNQAIKKFQQLIKNFPDSPYAAKSQFSIGLAYEQKGNITKALEEYQKVADKFPYSSEEVMKVIEAEYRLGNLILEKKSEDLWLKVSTFEGKCERAAKIFEQAIKISPYSAKAPEMQYKCADAYLEAKKYNDAEASYKKVMDIYPDSEWKDDSVYKLGLTAEAQALDSIYDQTKTEEAIKWYSEYLKKYPGGSQADDVKKRMAALTDKKIKKLYETAEYYEKSLNTESAMVYYRRIVNDFPESQWAEKARERMGALKK
jgi:outer membrane assembly lipoprotein YfiO